MAEDSNESMPFLGLCEIIVHCEQIPTGHPAVFLAPSMTPAHRRLTSFALHDGSSEYRLRRKTIKQSIPHADISFPHGTTLQP
jgi:hypothetical protein